MNQYSSYKDSGVEWIGEIPSYWMVSKLGFISKPIQGIQVDVENQLYNQIEGSKRFIRISDYTNDEEPRYIDSYPESCVVNKEDLVMVRYGSKSGKVYNGINGVICNNVFRIEHNNKLKTSFLYYFISQDSFYEQIEINRDNNTLPQVSHSLYKEMKTTLPPLSEQHQIVSYLDNKTSSIDSLIQSKEKKIELLKEKRTSLINQVVTKGLNPDVEMKDSGVEWIGEIPREWVQVKLSRIITTKQGVQVDVPLQKYTKEEGYERFLRITDYTNPYEEPRYVNVRNPMNYLVSETDIIMFRYGESGRVVKGLKGIICNNVFSISPTTEKVYNSFLYRVLSSEVFFEIIRSTTDNPTLSQVSHSQLKEQKIPLPPLSEQHQIVEYLDKETKLIDETISSEQKKIELLKEYKQSLISEVVTGKRKVVLN